VIINMMFIEEIPEVGDDHRDPNDLPACENGRPSYVQVAAYFDLQDDDRIYIHREYFYNMNNISKAALLVHEAIYKTARVLYNHASSVYARKVTGYLFSDMTSNELNLRKTYQEFFDKSDYDSNGIVDEDEFKHLYPNLYRFLEKLYGRNIFTITGFPRDYKRTYLAYLLKFSKVPDNFELARFHLQYFNLPDWAYSKELMISRDDLRYFFLSLGFLFERDEVEN